MDELDEAVDVLGRYLLCVSPEPGSVMCGGGMIRGGKRYETNEVKGGVRRGEERLLTDSLPWSK